MQRCCIDIAVEMWRCRCAEVQMCRGPESAESRCRDAAMWRCRCRGAVVQRGAEVHKCRDAEMCRKVQRSAAWRREEMQRRCSIGVEMLRCRVQRCGVQGAEQV